jgi:hypothetical protein
MKTASPVTAATHSVPTAHLAGQVYDASESARFAQAELEAGRRNVEGFIVGPFLGMSVVPTLDMGRRGCSGLRC